MRKNGKIYGIIFFVAIIVYAMAACESDHGSGTTANQTPVAGDFIFTKMTQTAGLVTDVGITPKEGKSKGAIAIKYAGSTTIPQTAGTYAVTFDVAAASGWNAATGLSAGMLTVNNANQTPVESDYDIGNLLQYVGRITDVTIIPKAGKSSGAIKIYYEGIEGTNYNLIEFLPQTAGTYAVTFDVASAIGWNAAEDLDPEKNLTIVKGIPALAYFNINSTTQTYDGTAKSVSISWKEDLPEGTIKNIKYNGSATAPTNAGTYPVTFDVTEDNNWNGASLSTNLIIIKGTPALSDYDFKLDGVNFVPGATAEFSMPQGGDPLLINITPKKGKSEGTMKIYYRSSDYPKAEEFPTEAGIYEVLLDVAENLPNWNEKMNLLICKLKITE